MKWDYLLYTVVFIVALLIIFPVSKRIYYKKMMTALNTGDFKAVEKMLDSFWCKITFSAFERESIRLSLLKMQGNATRADEQLQFMENMRLNRKQKVQLGEQGFYLYLEQGKVKKARRMLDLVKAAGSPEQALDLEIQYSILLKKESKYIDVLKERYAKLQPEQMDASTSLGQIAGTYEYLIGLQYFYNQDHLNTREWMEKALDHLKGTPYEPDIRRMLNA